MRRVAAQVLALLAALALLGQSTGFANAFEYDSVIHCCCGDHDADHECGCHDCPGHGRLRFRSTDGKGEVPTGTPSLRPCRGRTHSGAIPWVPALPPPPREGLPAALDSTRLTAPDPPPLIDRFPVAARPPP
ncbi:MAG: hypothetical protein EXR72_10895 [Myxococcales bacterium]|nr:hypothetical protein [Myxococcales bacterium]